MMEIDINKSFYDIAHDNDALRQAFVELGFKPMANSLTFNTVGKTISLKKALEYIGKSKEEAESFLKNRGIEVALYE